MPDRGLIDAVLAKVPQGSPVLDGSRGLAWDVRNTGARRYRYLAYAGAIVYRGDWSATTCAPSRERLSGTVVVIGRVRAGVVRCHGRPTTDRCAAPPSSPPAITTPRRRARSGAVGLTDRGQARSRRWG